jgi:hypothetical protein
MSNRISGPTEVATFAGPTLILTAIAPNRLTSGHRASKLIGSTVVNELDVTIGTVDDLIVSPSEKSAFAVLSIGGFLGIGAKYAVVPLSSLEVQKTNTHLLLRGATEESLKNLPDYSYAA